MTTEFKITRDNVTASIKQVASATKSCSADVALATCVGTVKGAQAVQRVAIRIEKSALSFGERASEWLKQQAR